MKLRRLSNAEYAEAERQTEMLGVPLDECPTCNSKDTEQGRTPGIFRHNGKGEICDCETQMALRKHYLLANIGDQYARLDWAEYDGPEVVRNGVQAYLEKWRYFKLNGMGLEFNSKGLGTGKSFGATHIGKELIKQGERVYFSTFAEMVSAYQKSNAEEIEAKLKGMTVLILDEITAPSSQAQGQFFQDKFEELIRHRTNFNLPTITTTNLSEEELLRFYPRPYSLMEAKQYRIVFEGEDARIGKVREKNIERVQAEEIAPFS